MSEWLGLIGALAGTGIGGFVTYMVAAQQQSHERQLEKRRRKIEACEAIYDLLSTIASQASTLSMGVIGDLGYGSPLKADILKEKIQFDRLRMLVDFYAPELKPCVKEMFLQLGIIGKAVGEVMLEKSRTDEWKANTVKAGALASMEIERLAREAQEKLGELMQALTAEG
jgi:hypothetical protein